MAELSSYELKVLEGKDKGQVVPLETDSITLGRSYEGRLEVEPDKILFAEPSVAKVHAMLIWSKKDESWHLSNRSQTAPSKVNGQGASHARLAPGAKIQLGDLVLEFCGIGDVPAGEVEIKPLMPQGASGFLGGEPPPAAAPPPAWLLRPGAAAGAAGPVAEPGPATPPAEEATRAKKPKKLKKEEPEAAPAPAAEKAAPPAAARPDAIMGFLEMAGPKGAKGESFPVYGRRTTIGRSPDCDICLEESRVSRLHASIEWEGDRPFLVQESSTGSTKVGRTYVKERHPLVPGDEVVLADRVFLKWTKG